jgi:SAM-dependent methyltransferase
VQGFDPRTSFGADVAATYDEDEVRGDESETVAFLADVAGDGPALELAIGTGRIGLPLAATGIRVDGIDLSPDMVQRLRAKPGGDQLAVTMGDFASVDVPGSYRLIYVVFNTFFNLLAQDDQVRCFENVAEHLTDDGVFVIEAGTPWKLFGLDGWQYVRAERIRADQVTLDVATYDPVTQLYDESHVHLSAEGTRLAPIVTRYCTPGELDLMARIAGLRLVDRWGGWQGEPFTADSRRHISVWGRSI